MARRNLTGLGTYLDRARLRRGMTVTELMAAADLSRSTWYKLTEGTGVHRRDTVRNVAEVLGVDPAHALWLAAVNHDVSAGRELEVLSEDEIVELISAGMIELRRRAVKEPSALRAVVAKLTEFAVA